MKVKTERLTKHDFLAIAVMHMMVTRTPKSEDFCKVFNIVPGADSDVELKLTINGVEVEFQDFMNELERQHNTMLEDCAKNQIDGKTHLLLDRLSEIVKQAEDAITEQIETTFPGRKVW